MVKSTIYKNIAILIIALMGSGCLTTRSSMHFPKGIKAQCYGALHEARDAINSKGGDVKIGATLIITTVPGIVYIDGMWLFRDSYSDGLVAGYCTGTTVKVGANPSDRNDVSTIVLIHECAHYLLLTNYDERGHNVKYRYVLPHWRD